MRLGLGLAIMTMSCAAQAQSPASPVPLRPDQQAFRALYREMVETDTSITTGSCTDLATKIAAHFGAGIPTNGVPGPWGDPDGDGVHGLNERNEARALFVGRDFLSI